MLEVKGVSIVELDPEEGSSVKKYIVISVNQCLRHNLGYKQKMI